MWRALRWYETVGVLLLGALLGAASMAHIIGWPKWLAEIGGQTWAGWVQAVGSIAAIIGAAKIADRARKEDTEARQRDLLRKEINAVNRVLSAVNIASNRIGFLKLCLRGQPAAPTVDSIEKVKDCLPMLKTALDGLDEAGGLWALGQPFIQQLPEVVRTAQVVLDSPLPTPDLLNTGSFSDQQPGINRLLKANKAIQSASVALQSAEEIHKGCRAFIENPAISVLR